MGFSKQNFTPTFEVVSRVPKAHGGGEIKLTLRVATTLEYEAVRTVFLGKTEAERTPETVLQTVRQFVCAQLTAVSGIEDFPVDEKTTLSTRALDYFTETDADLQEFFDTLLMAAWINHKDLSEPETFPRNLPSDSA